MGAIALLGEIHLFGNPENERGLRLLCLSSAVNELIKPIQYVQLQIGFVAA
jgi:hypothetical protein